MRAVWYEESGDAGVLQVGEMPDPEPGPGEVRVRVIDVSTNAVRFDYSHELVAVTWTGP